MAKLSSLSWLLLLLFATTLHAQEDGDAPAPAEGTGDGEDDAADAAGKSAEECEEAWGYVEFLKEDVILKVTDTITAIKDTSDSQALDKTIGDTMQKVMDIRQSLLERIKGIRQDEVDTCPDQNIKQEQKLSEFRMQIMTILLSLVDAESNSVDNIKEIATDLLRFKSTAQQEVMRLLMLPENKAPVVRQGDCSECKALEDLNKKLENLKDCASKDEDSEDAPDDAEGTEQAEEDDSASCTPPEDYASELIGANEEIDKEIANLYNSVRAEKDPAKKDELFRTLKSYKKLRDQIEEIIVKLISEKGGPEKLKKTIERSLRRLLLELQSQIKQCLSQCGSVGCGDSCGAKVVDETIEKMKDYKEIVSDPNREEEEKKEFVRGELIKLINENNGAAREILIATANSADGTTEDCDQEKFDIYDVLKGPMWMLVNTTIFGSIGEVEVMVDAMIEQLEDLLEKYCGSDPVIPPSTEDGPNCEWEEYKQITKNYLEKIDEIIQEALFKDKDKDKLKAILGFVDIQAMFDNRVKKLFEEELKCPDEVNVIKKEFMGQLNQCMKDFLDTKVQFSKMSRLQRISCIKVLRNSMEDRSAKLLQYELEKSLSGISK